VKRRISVLTTNPSLGILTYSLPEGKAVAAGQLVSIPLGPRQILGMLWEEDVSNQIKIADNRLRPVSKIYDLPEASHCYRKFIQWVSSYYMAPLGAVLRMGIPFLPATIESREIKNYYVPKREWPKLTSLRQQALEKLSGEKGSVRELAEKAEVSPAVIRALIKTGLITEQKTSLEIALSLPNPDFNAPILSETQSKAAEILKESIAKKSFETFLLDGVTGSGKTEVYFEAIAQTLRDGKQSLILLPEIALTEPFLKRFQARFGCEPVVWHSDLSQARRRKNWQAIVTGQAKVVIGARSALFLPFKAIGLIIVDEAHETSFKQEDGVCYQARDVAVMRAKFENISVILATATPAIESVMQVRLGNYKEIRLAERHGSAGLPTIHVINMTEQALAKGRWLAPPLVKALTNAVERHEQGLLFLNRRGYAPLTLCRHCGHRIKCPHCTAWMVEHRQLGQMICHHCGFTMPVPDKCPECQTADSLVACGPGVERIAEETALLFPEARIETITSDTLATPKQAAEFVEKMDQGAIDIIIGTQLITKGYHFPRLTVVGVVDADIGLQGGDLRASEHSFQQIAQVAGRAGRSALDGHVFIQTYEPETPVISALASGDREAFYQTELEIREITEAPPFGRYVALIISSEKQEIAEAVGHQLGQRKPEGDGIEVFGPAPAPLLQLRGRYRYRFLIQAKRNIPIQRIIHQWLSKISIPSSVRITIDVDPYSFF